MNFYQENDVWQALLTQPDVMGQRAKAAEFAKLLLERVTPSKRQMAAYAQDNLLDLVLEYQAVGQIVQRLLAQAQPKLELTDLADGGQDFTQQLDRLRTEFAHAQAEYQRISAERQQYQQVQDQLQAEQQRLMPLQQEAAVLQQHLAALRQALPPLQAVAARLPELHAQASSEAATVIEVVLQTLDQTLVPLQQWAAAYRVQAQEQQRLAQAFSALPTLEGLSVPIAALRQQSQTLAAQMQGFDTVLRDLTEAVERQQTTLRQRRQQ